MRLHRLQGSLLLILVSTSALAHPTTPHDDAVGVELNKSCNTRSSAPPDLIAADRAWCAAASESAADAAGTRWEAAAIAFDKAVASAGAAQAESACTAVYAWENAVTLDSTVQPQLSPAATPPPFTRLEMAFLGSLEVCIRLSPPEELPAMIFKRANRYQRHQLFDEAMPSLVELVTKYPESDVSEFAAIDLLDGLNRQNKLDQLDAWVEQLRANTKLLKTRKVLVRHLDTLHVQKVRRRAETEEEAGVRDPSAYLRCAQLYLGEVKDHPLYGERDELLFNAASCYERAGAIGDAVRTYRAAAKVPGSRLATLARSRAAELRR